MLIGAGVLVVYGVLAVMSGGTFWPFTVIPQASWSGSTWTKVLVRDVPPEDADAVQWKTTSLDSLPGRPVALADYDLAPERLAPYVDPSQTWTDEQEAQLRAVLEPALRSNHALLLYRVRGSLPENGVSVSCTPVVILRSDTLVTAPEIRARDTSRSEGSRVDTPPHER